MSTSHLVMIGVWVAVVAFGLLFLYLRAQGGRGLAVPTATSATSAPTPATRHTSLVNGSAVSVTGTPVCLSARDPNGVQTMQCAMGIQANDGFYYALKDNTPDYTYLSKIQNGKTATVTGVFTLSAQTQYQSEGTITITGVSQ
jgi:hypothetical protein